MIEREKVVRAIEACVAGLCECCPYYKTEKDFENNNCKDDLMADVRTLLMDRKPVVTTNAYGKKFYKCANCGFDFELDFGKPRLVKVCRNCGQGVMWK